MRNLWKAQLQLHAGVFKDGTSPAYQHDPEGKTLLIVGMGGIGRVSSNNRCSAISHN
jgi:lactate dehydrogenase-like 2-hydroxyacid dehydrogenase